MYLHVEHSGGEKAVDVHAIAMEGELYPWTHVMNYHELHPKTYRSNEKKSWRFFQNLIPQQFSSPTKDVDIAIRMWGRASNDGAKSLPCVARLGLDSWWTRRRGVVKTKGPDGSRWYPSYVGIFWLFMILIIIDVWLLMIIDGMCVIDDIDVWQTSWLMFVIGINLGCLLLRLPTMRVGLICLDPCQQWCQMLQRGALGFQIVWDEYRSSSWTAEHFQCEHSYPCFPALFRQGGSQFFHLKVGMVTPKHSSGWHLQISVPYRSLSSKWLSRGKINTSQIQTQILLPTPSVGWLVCCWGGVSAVLALLSSRILKIGVASKDEAMYQCINGQGLN